MSNKNLISFWELTPASRHELTTKLLKLGNELDLKSCVVEHNGELVNIPNYLAAIRSVISDNVIKVCMGEFGKPNKNGCVYGEETIAAIQRRLRQGNLYGEYDTPKEGGLDRFKVIDMEKVSHEVMDATTDGKYSYIHIRTLAGKLGDALVGSEKPSFGIRGICRMSKAGGLKREFIDIISFDYIGDEQITTANDFTAGILNQ